jgi:hypothetical protein
MALYLDLTEPYCALSYSYQSAICNQGTSVRLLALEFHYLFQLSGVSRIIAADISLNIHSTKGELP